MRRQQSYWRGMAFFLPLLAAVLIWRAGYMPGFVYEGPLRDEVKRRTGFDLADRGSLNAPEVELREAEGVPGRIPAVVAEFENVGDRPVKEFRVVAVFRSRSDENGPRSRVMHLAGAGQPPLEPGQRRRIRFESGQPYNPRTFTGAPAPIYADLYWGSLPTDGVRNRRDAPNEVERLARWYNQQPDVTDIVVRP